MQEFFKSETSHDELSTVLIKKSHKALFKIVTIDDATEHIKLTSTVNEKLKKEDIKWVEMALQFTPLIPPNTISYVNKYNDNFVCHIEDFERFYLANITKMIQQAHVYCDNSKVVNNGWTVVSGHKTAKRDKYLKLVKELQVLVGDWNSM